VKKEYAGSVEMLNIKLNVQQDFTPGTFASSKIQ
jgi:hypothetical protein